MFHISDIKKYNRCQRQYYLSNDINEPYLPFLRNDEELTKLVVNKLGLKDYYMGVKGDDANRVIDELPNYEWFVKARFEFANLRIKLPFLHKLNDGYEIFFVLFALYPKIDDLNFYVYNVWVLKNLGFNIKDIHIIHLNEDYVRGDELDVDELFIINDYFYNLKRHKVAKIYETIMNKEVDLYHTLYEMENYTLDDFKAIKQRKCKQYGLCKFYNTCFDEEELPDDSILTLVSSKYKNEMYAEGIKYLKDVDTERIEGTRCQYAQIRASINGGLYFDRQALGAWLDGLENKTLAFIDFEWERYLIPPFKGLKPYDVVCFEYSLHILNKDKTIDHHVFIDKGDCREDFIKSIIEHIPDDAVVLAYNAIGAEILRLKELADQFPLYKDKLENICDRFVDMSFPFVNGLVYDIKMKGNYSVKSLLGVVSTLSYDNLDIKDGMEAVYKWREIDREENENEKAIKDELKDYCSLDSYSLVLIYKWLKNISQQ